MSERHHDESPPAPVDLRKDHPELYGALLALNERIDRSGGWSGWALFTLWVLVVVGIIGEWMPEVFGSPIQRLQSIWVYALFALLCFATSLRLQTLRRRAVYRGGRDEIEREMANAGLSPNRLIAAMQGDKAIELVAAEIKGDDAFDTRRR